jgi:hypothetical protein
LWKSLYFRLPGGKYGNVTVDEGWSYQSRIFEDIRRNACLRAYRSFEGAPIEMKNSPQHEPDRLEPKYKPSREPKVSNLTYRSNRPIWHDFSFPEPLIIELLA